MHIAVVYDCLYPSTTGGGERQYRAFAEQFARRGHRVTYLTRVQWDGSPPPVPGVDVRAVAGRASLYDSAGNRRLGPALGFALAVFAHLVRRRRSYDAVLVSALPSLNVPAAVAALLGARTVVCSDFLEVWRLHQWVAYSGPVVGRVAWALQRLAVRLSPLASCHSRMNAGRLLREGCRTEPVVSPGLVHGGIVAASATQPASPPVVVSIGRMIPDKQVTAIPAAIAWARRSVPDLRAVLIGDGEQRAAVTAQVQALGLEDVVQVPGRLSEEEVADVLSSAACLVNPSRREGYGIVVVEACAVGVPVVVVDAPDNAALELVRPGVNGAVAASTAPDALGAAVLDVVGAGMTLRRSAAEWFLTEARYRTMEASADQLLSVLGSEVDRRQSNGE